MRERVERVLEVGVVLAALGTIPLIVLQEQGVTDPTVFVLDWLVWSVFLAEYLGLLAMAGDRPTYVRRNWFNLAVVVLSFPALPALFAVVRLTRLARLFRLLRLLGVAGRGLVALRVVFGRRGFVYVASVTAFFVFSGSAVLTVVEPDATRGSIFTALWWATVTVTTVGYGDIVPSTLVGRMIGVALMLAGVGLVSTLAASIAAYFVGQDGSEDLKRVSDRLDRIERLLGQLAEAERRVGRQDIAAP